MSACAATPSSRPLGNAPSGESGLILASCWRTITGVDLRLKVGGLPSEVKEAEIILEKARLCKKIAERVRSS